MPATLRYRHREYAASPCMLRSSLRTPEYLRLRLVSKACGRNRFETARASAGGCPENQPGTCRAPVRSRINLPGATRGLMRSGLVTGVHAQVDLKLINRPVQAMVAIRVRPPSRTVIHSFHAFITALPETLSVFVMSGNDNFLVHVAVRDN